MSVPPESVEVGRCYLTESGSVRKVTSTGSDGLVRHKERIGTEPLRYNGNKKRMRHDFAAPALREVPCDRTPETNSP